MTSLIKYNNPYRVAEIFQAIDIKMAFVTKIDENTYKQQHLAVKCRDFLGDCIWSKETGKDVSIYSFQYSYKNAPFDDNRLQLSLTFPNMETKENFINNFDWLRNKELKVKIGGSAWEATDDPLSLIIIADKAWQSSQWKLSLFTFYLKVISYPSVLELKSPEDSYIKVLTPEKEEILLKNITSDIKHIHDNIHMAHNYSGFVSVIKNQNKELHSALFGKV